MLTRRKCPIAFAALLILLAIGLLAFGLNRQYEIFDLDPPPESTEVFVTLDEPELIRHATIDGVRRENGELTRVKAYSLETASECPT